jgi:hypothetical protein
VSDPTISPGRAEDQVEDLPVAWSVSVADPRSCSVMGLQLKLKPEELDQELELKL